MAKAKVNFENVVGFQNAVENQSNSFNNINASFNSKLTETNNLITNEKEKIGSVLEQCSAGINRLSAKIAELNELLKSLQAELAATPPTITIVTTDEDGNSVEEEVPNPRYEELLEEINAVENRIIELEEIKTLFINLQSQARRQSELLSTALNKLDSLREELRGHFQQIGNYSEETVRKLKDIYATLSKYSEAKILPPSFKNKKETNGKGLLNAAPKPQTNIRNESLKDSNKTGEFTKKYKHVGRTKDFLLNKYYVGVEKHVNSLNNQQKMVLQYYCGDGFSTLNSFLRKNDNTRYYGPDTQEKIDLITQSFKNNKMPQDATLYRGMDQPWILKDFQNKSLDELRKEFIGTTCYDEAFVSTSISKKVATETFSSSRGGTVMEISAPKGSDAILIGDKENGIASHYEYEVLLNRGSAFKITEIDERVGGGFYIKAKLIGLK